MIVLTIYHVDEWGRVDLTTIYNSYVHPRTCRKSPRGEPSPLTSGILFVADLFHPVHDLAVELFLSGNVCHGGCLCGALPLLFPGGTPEHPTTAGFFHLDPPALL